MNIKEKLTNGKTIFDIPLRVTYYARVSTDHELQATSILNQVDYFKKLIQTSPNWQFIEGYIDEGISGKEVKKRENFLRMIHDAKNKKFDLILTKSVSRFARNTVDSINYVDILLKYEVGVYFLNDNINTLYSDSEFRLTLMASIAQDELRKLSESVQFGLAQSIKRGVVLGGNNLIGYHKSKGKLTINKEEANIIKDIYKIFSKDLYTYQDISNKIYSKYHKKIDATTIRRILKNYKYKGYYCGGKTKVINYKTSIRQNIPKNNWIIYKDENIPPIIEEKLWNKVQKIIEKRKKTPSKYANKLYCQTHHKYLKNKTKKYKNKIYSYYICPLCSSFKEEFFSKFLPFSKIIIEKKEEEYLLKVIAEKPKT